jgi:hypothetical protein
MKKLLLFLLLVMGQVTFAQKYTIQGRVIDKKSGGLPSASVQLLQLNDSSVVNTTVTDTSGRFILTNIEKAAYILKVTFVGYVPYIKNIADSSAADTLQLGLITLQPDAISLTEVSVKGQKEAVVVKKDTLEYNASSFRTRPNASVEKLLKKLPGVEIGADGSIRVQGENVTRIFVDGKEFFGGDLAMATRNLPADAIYKIEVINAKSKGTQFSGVDDGKSEKIINLTLKEKRRNTGFGNAQAGIGTSSRYSAQGNYNLFAKGNQLSVVGRSNNVNNQEPSADGQGSGGGGQNGVVTTHLGGVNLSRQLTKQTRINGSYRLNYQDAEILTNLTRQNFLPGGTALYYENSQSRNTTGLHNATAGLEHEDSTNSIRLNTSFSYSDAATNNQSSRQSFSVADTLVNAGERAAITGNKNKNVTANLFYGHRFGKTGRLFSITNEFSVLQTHTLGRSASATRFSDGAEETIRQRNEQEVDDFNFNVQLAYTEPIGKKQYLQANYTITNRASASDLAVYDIVNETSLLNTEQSSQFRSDFLVQRGGLTYQFTGDKYNLAISSQVQQSTLSRRNVSEGSLVRRSFQNILPDVHFNLRLNKTTSINVDYSTSVREPTISQLQPIVLRYDPLNLFVGNPTLRPEYSQQGKLNFNTFDSQSGVLLSGGVTFNYTTNPITAAVTIDERQVRTTQYVNVAQSNNVGATLTLGIPVKKFSSRFNLGPYLNQGRSLNLLNGIASAISQRAVGGIVSYAFSYEDYVDLNLRANLTAASSKYELNENQNQLFVNSTYTADATVHFFKSFNFTTEFNYRRFKNAKTNFDQSIPILNFSLSKALLKNDRGELILSALNVLNRNVGITQLATLNYVEQVNRNTLGSYYMLSFSYRLKKPTI